MIILFIDEFSGGLAVSGKNFKIFVRQLSRATFPLKESISPEPSTPSDLARDISIFSVGRHG
jgi:hypothetical protein